MKGRVFVQLGGEPLGVLKFHVPASRELLVADFSAAGGGGLPLLIKGSEDDSG